MLDVIRDPSRAFLATFAVVLVLVGVCSGPANSQGSKESEGLLFGSIVGGIIGSQIGGDRVVGAIAGAAIGGFIGSQIGASLDEEDRLALSRTTKASLTSGQRKAFANKRTGVRGSATVTSSTTNAKGQPCRTVRQDVILKDGTRMSDTVSACRGPNGWEV